MNYLLNFLKDWLKWAENIDMQAGKVCFEDELLDYDKGLGLCGNTMEYYSSSVDGNIDDLKQMLKEELDKDFKHLTGYTRLPQYAHEELRPRILFPFNDGDAAAYCRESNKGLCHKNPERLKWVRNKIAELQVKVDAEEAAKPALIAEIKEHAALAEYTVDMDSAHSTVAVSVEGEEDVFLQGDEAESIIDEVSRLYHSLGEITTTEAELWATKDLI